MLEHYEAILRNEATAKYLNADFSKLVPLAEKLVNPCRLCEWRCMVDRHSEKGFCGVGYESRVSSAFLHWGEESFLVPSGTIFFTGCNFRCVYCQNWEISQHPEAGEVWTPQEIADWITQTQAINVNFVGGEPTPHLHNIVKALSLCKRNIPIIWNSNMYASKESMEILNQIVDLWLADFRYGNDDCASRLSKVKNYFATITRNLKLAQGDMVIRVLVLPNHIDCCALPILDWIAKHRRDAIVNLLSQYWPAYKASECEEINRKLTREEYQRVIEHAKELGLNFLTQA